MKPVSDFYARVIPYVPGCPNTFASQAIVDSAIYFCEHSLALRFIADEFSTVAGVSQYDVDVPTNHLLSRIIYTTVDGDEIHPVVATSLPLVASQQSKPTKYYVTQSESELQLNLSATPDDAYPVNMSLALRPTVDAKFLATELYDYWHEPIAFGALARLKSAPGQPYTDLAEANFYSQKAKMLCKNARNEGNISRIVGSLQTQPRPFV